MPQKIARIKVPRNKWMDVCDAMRPMWPIKSPIPGVATLGVFDDYEDFLSGYKIITLEGDHHMIEPLIHTIMKVLLS